MFANSVKITLMDNQCDNFGVRLGTKIWEAGLNPHRVAKMAGVDYPNLNKIINHPDKFQPTMDMLNKLESLPFLADFIAKEKAERLYKEYRPEIVVQATIRLLKQDPSLAQQWKSEMKELLNDL